MPSPNLSEIITTTLRNRSGVLADNVSDNNALLLKMKQRGNVKPFSGGRTIVEELFYQENSTYTRYSGYDLLDITPSDVITAAEFDIKQVAVSVSMNGLEMIQNSGPQQVIDLLEARIQNAEQSLMNGIAADIYSDGTADGGKQIGGLQLLIAASPSTGTVGGIDRATWTFWRNQVFDASDNSITLGPTTIQNAMNQTMVLCVRGRDVPDLIVAGNTRYTDYLGSLQNIQRISDDRLAAAGFATLKYYGAGANCDVVLDGGIGGNMPATDMYFINTKYLMFRPHTDRNMVPLGDDRYSINQDAMVKIIGWAGNMTTRGPQFCALLKP